jgi:hypothetical protein
VAFGSPNLSGAEYNSFLLPSKYSNIPPLDLEINDFADQKWFHPQPVNSSKKIKYQVKNAPNAHWGIHNALIVGACPVPAKTEQYPFSNAKYLQTVTRRELEILVKEHGITTFLSLMDECDENGNEASKFRPYSKLDLPVIDPNVKFSKLPIKDCKTTDDNSLLEFAKLTVQLLQSGEKIYLHCWGGHGRAGTVYCLVLQLAYGMTANEALDYCQRIHDCRQSYITVGSPQTLEQATQVRRLEEIILALAKAEADERDLALAKAEADERALALAKTEADERALALAKAEADERALALAKAEADESCIETEQVEYDNYNHQDYDYQEDCKYNNQEYNDQAEYDYFNKEECDDYYDDDDDDNEYDNDDGYNSYDDVAETLEDIMFIPKSVSINPYSNKAVRAKVQAYRNNNS